MVHVKTEAKLRKKEDLYPTLRRVLEHTMPDELLCGASATGTVCEAQG